VDFLKDEIPRRAAEAAATEVSNTRRTESHVLETSATELAATQRSLESLSHDVSVLKAAAVNHVMETSAAELAATQRSLESLNHEMETSAAELVATQRSLESLSHDVGVLKAWQGASGEEAVKEREALEQRFRIIRQEQALAIEELRTELPRAGPETERPALQHEAFRESQNEASCRRLGAAGMNVSGLEELDATATGVAADLPSRDFGTLREDLTILKSRQEFLKNELKSLVDSASRGAQQPVGTHLGVGRGPAPGAVRDGTSSRKELAKNVQSPRSASS